MRFFVWHFSRRALPYWVVLICDYLVVYGSLLVATVFNDGLVHTFGNLLHVSMAIGFYMAFYLLGFRLFRTYSGVVRYSTFVDLYRLASAVLISMVAGLLVRCILPEGRVLTTVSVEDLLLGGLLATLLMWLMRIVMKLTYDTINQDRRGANVMIFGTKQGGVAIAKSLANLTERPLHLVGFITNLKDMEGHFLMSKRVIGHGDERLWNFIEDHKVSMVLISPLVQDFFVNECQELIDRLIRHRIRIMMLPRGQEWDGKSVLSHVNMHEVSVEDLLPRQKIDVDLAAIGAMLKGQRILITGAAGSIGSEMARQVAKFEPEEMVLIDQAETPMHDLRLMMARKYPGVKALTIVTSITNQTHMERIFSEHRPQYVFHAAAYKHVPMMEDNPALAVQNNVYGTRVIADAP